MRGREVERRRRVLSGNILGRSYEDLGEGSEGTFELLELSALCPLGRHPAMPRFVIGRHGCGTPLLLPSLTNPPRQTLPAPD